MQKKWIEFIQKPSFVLGLLTLFTLLVTAQEFHFGTPTHMGVDIRYTHYNNFVIFVDSFLHLIHYQDLYILYPDEHWDLYKYSPTFALLMAPFAYLPTFLGIFLWDLLNVAVLFFAFRKMPMHGNKTWLFMLLIVLMELITSIQNSQSNALIAGLIIWAFALLEREKYAWASLFLVLTVFIKLFGIVAFALFLFYPKKTKLAAYSLLWTLILAALPLLVISFSQLIFLYESWNRLLANDFDASYGFSVAGIIHSWFQLEVSKNWVVLLGAFVFCIPLVRYKCYRRLNFRRLYLASVLIWVVIFNHKAESPTFIIAMAGVVIWFFSQKKSALNIALLIFSFVLTVLSPTDFFPKYWRENYVIPYALKALPCVLIWLKISFDLLCISNQSEENL
jgi:hypothetical protein